MVRTFYRRGIIETWGRGTLKIARLMQEAGHRPPTVSLREGAVIMTFGLPWKTPGGRQGNARENPDDNPGAPEKTNPICLCRSWQPSCASPRVRSIEPVGYSVTQASLRVSGPTRVDGGK